MVFKRYIYRDGKKFGPYYYESYRDEKGNTHTRYVEHPHHLRAVTKIHHSKNLFRKHSTLFILLGAIIVIFLTISFLNYQFSENQKNSNSNFFESIGKGVYAFVTGHTTEENPASTSDNSASDSTTESTNSETTSPELSNTDISTPEVIPETTPSTSPEIIPSPSDNSSDGNNIQNDSGNGTADSTIPSENQTLTENNTTNETTSENINETANNQTSIENKTESGNGTIDGESGGSGGIISGNETHINQSFANETNQTLTENVSGNLTIETSVKQYGAVLGKPVRWEKKVKVVEGSGNNLNIDLPNAAGNVSVKKIDQDGEKNIDVNVRNEKKISDNQKNSSSNFITSTFNFILGFLRFTGNTVSQGQDNDVSVQISDQTQTQDEFVVEYYTDAPYLQTEQIDNKTTRLTIVGPEGIVYENVLAFMDINDTTSRKVKLSLNDQIINLTFLDENGNSLSDGIQWIIPILDGNQDYILKILNGTNIRVIVKLKDSNNKKEIKDLGEIRDSIKINNENLEILDVDEDLVSSLSSDPNVESVVEDQSVSLLLEDSDILIRSYEAKTNYGLNGNGEKICIVDSGVDYTHPAITNYVSGYDFVNNDSDPMDDNGHGTSVSGVISYIAPGSQLYVAKVIDANGTGYESNVLQGLQWCIDNNVEIISFSIGSGNYNGYCNDNILAQLVNSAVAQGIFVAAATGNDWNTSLKSPSCAENATRVGSSTKTDGISEFSSGGDMVDVLAPGQNVNVPILGNEYSVRSGTSISSPMVAAGAAIVLQNETLNPSQLKNRLKTTGKPIEYNVDLITVINISRIDVVNALLNNVTMVSYNYSGNRTSSNETNQTYEELANGCTVGSCADGNSCCNVGATICAVAVAGTTYTCQDADATSFACVKSCNSYIGLTAAAACTNSLSTVGVWFQSPATDLCCGNDAFSSGTADNFNGNATEGCCCQAQGQIGTGNDGVCSSNSNYWCIDGTYCTSWSGLASDPSLPATGTTYSLSGDDIICGCMGSGDGVKCDTSDAGATANGLCVSDGTCDTGDVRYESSEYWGTCDSAGASCDSDVTPTATTPRYVTDGICASGGCDNAGEACLASGSYYNDCSAASCDSTTGTVYVCDATVTDGSFTTGGICGEAEADGVDDDCLTSAACKDSESSNAIQETCECSTATDWDPYDSSVTGGAFTADGICSGTTGDTAGEACYDDANYQTDCSSCSKSSADADGCDLAVSDGAYSTGGICVEAGADDSCTSGEVCVASSTFYPDCSIANCDSTTGTVYACDSSVSDGAYGVTGICGEAGNDGVDDDCLTSACKDSEASNKLETACNCAAAATDWDTYDSSVTGGAFSANGICIGAVADTTGEACYDSSASTYYNDCTSCGKSVGASNDPCDSSITDGSYSPNGFCVEVGGDDACDINGGACSNSGTTGTLYSDCSSCGQTAADNDACMSGTGTSYTPNGMCVFDSTCDTDEVCDGDTRLNSDCSSCSSATSDVDKCDSNGGTSFVADGYCSASGTCSTGGVYNNSGTLTNGCSNGDGNLCDADAAGTENGDWSTYVDGVCVFGSVCDNNEVAKNCTYAEADCSYYFDGCNNVNVNNNTRCDSDADNSGYTTDGVCISGTCTACAADETLSCSDNMDNDCDGLVDSLDSIDCVSDSPPQILLITPIDTQTFNSLTVTFNASVWDDINLTNVSLYGNWSGWHLNETNTSGINNSFYLFTKDFSGYADGTYMWGYEAYDNTSQRTESSNRTFNIITAPTIDSYYPLTTPFSIVEPNNEVFNITYTNYTGPVTIKWFVNDTEKTAFANSDEFNWDGNYTQAGTYRIKVNITNSRGTAEQIWTMGVDNAYATVDINRTYPVADLNVSQSNFFNVTFNITCRKDNCGAINVSLFANDTLANITSGGVPFYTNATTNPLTTTSLNMDQSELITFWLNATGNINISYPFAAYANLTSNLSINNITSRWNVTITDPFALAIDLSPYLGSQINWTVETIPSFNLSADGNNGSGISEYWINLSVSGGTADLYIRANDNLTSGSNVIVLSNETYSYNSSNFSVPSDLKSSITTNFADNKIGDSLSSGVVYLKFFLNVPASQPAGIYNNTVEIKALQSGQAP